jgi:hypothetical protein
MTEGGKVRHADLPEVWPKAKWGRQVLHRLRCLISRSRGECECRRESRDFRPWPSTGIRRGRSGRAAINSHDYQAYAALLDPQLRQDLTTGQFERGYQSTADTGETLAGTSVAANGDTVAAVTFTSHQGLPASYQPYNGAEPYNDTEPDRDSGGELEVDGHERPISYAEVSGDPTFDPLANSRLLWQFVRQGAIFAGLYVFAAHAGRRDRRSAAPGPAAFSARPPVAGPRMSGSQPFSTPRRVAANLSGSPPG